MAEILKGLQPQRVFDYFEEICAIPHGSDNIRQISDYLVQFAQKHGLWYVQESCGNVIMKKPATPGYEEEPTVILQGHMDMVAVKEEGCKKDLRNEGLDLFVEDGLIGARGTSLGGDDGIALAYAMAVLESDTIPHPALEFVATVNEETGMDGAAAIDASLLEGRQLLNIDSEEEGILLTGCAGGVTAKIVLPRRTMTMSGMLCRVRVSGLQGGHSGADIHRNRENAILLLGRVLCALNGEIGIVITSMHGGTKDNVIPDSAQAILCLNEVQIPIAEETVARMEKELQNAFAAKEPGLRVTFDRMTNMLTCTAYNDETRMKILSLLQILPYGVYAMSGELEGLVETSNNVGLIREESDHIAISCSVRSSIASEKRMLYKKIERMASLCGATVRRTAEYPGWQYRTNSPLRDRFVECYREQFGTEPVIQTIHAGLECGLFIEKIPEMDAISFGPNIFDIHSTKERVDIASTERYWKLLLRLLAKKSR